MSQDEPAPLFLKPADRFARFARIDWWRQETVSKAKVLLVGVGALGNEALKNLCLLGIGHIALIDMDRVEKSNLSRSVLFRERDEGRPKVEAAAAAARDLHPGSAVTPLFGNVLSDLGLGWVNWADVVIGALDNREARVCINRLCAMTQTPWFDGAIDVLDGVARGFFPPSTSCYECTMSAVDWKLLNARRSCSLLGRLAAEGNGVPTTPTTASVIAAIQVQEAVKLLHGKPALLGKGFVFEGLMHSSYECSYPINPDCELHAAPEPLTTLPDVDSAAPLMRIWEEGRKDFGEEPDALDLTRELLKELLCPACKTTSRVLLPVQRVRPETVPCPTCGAERTPTFMHSLSKGDPLLSLTAREIGLPLWDAVYLRKGLQRHGYLIEGDRSRFFTEDAVPRHRSLA